MKSFDPILLQRLIDGELDSQSTREMLSQADADPRLWRDIATHFVEDQNFRKGFVAEVTKTFVETNPAKPESRPVSGFRFLALAAAVLVALGLGFLGGQNFSMGPTSDPGSQMASNPDQGTMMADNIPSLSPLERDGNQIADHRQVSFRPDYHLQLQDPNGNPVMDSEVPLYRPETAQRLGVMQDRTLPPEFVQHVFDQGYGVNQNVNYISGHLNDGRRFVVPVQTINFAPGQ